MPKNNKENNNKDRFPKKAHERHQSLSIEEK